MTAAAKPVPIYTIVKVEKEFGIHRNAVFLQTPVGANFIIPTLFLAEAIAEEGRGQSGKLDPASMPLTQLASTAIDITHKQRHVIVEQVSAYAGSELLCHRAEYPEELVQRQQELWQPILDWCQARFGARLRTGQGVIPITQPLEALQALRGAVESYDDFYLTGLRQAVEVSGSLLLGLALIERPMTAEEVFRTAECDALFQMQKWGEDPATLKRHESIRRDLEACERWFQMLTKKSK